MPKHHYTPVVNSADYAAEYDSGFCDGIDNIEPPDGAGQAYLDGWIAARNLGDLLPVELAGFTPREYAVIVADAQAHADWRDDRSAQSLPL